MEKVRGSLVGPGATLGRKGTIRQPMPQTMSGAGLAAARRLLGYSGGRHMGDVVATVVAFGRGVVIWPPLELLGAIRPDLLAT